MSIEKILERLAVAAERQATALEALSGSTTDSPEESESETQTSSEPEESEASEPSSPDSGTSQEISPVELTAAGVREKLKELQKLTNSATTRELMSKFGGARLIKEIPEERYGELVVACDKLIADADD